MNKKKLKQLAEEIVDKIYDKNTSEEYIKSQINKWYMKLLEVKK